MTTNDKQKLRVRKNMLRIAELLKERGYQYTFGAEKDGYNSIDMWTGIKWEKITRGTRIADLWWLT